MSARTRFEEELHRFPEAGTGVHGHVMRLANLAALAGIPEQEATTSIKAAMPRSPSPGNEVEAALAKAAADDGDSSFRPRPRLSPRQREAQRREKERRSQANHAATRDAVHELAGGTLDLAEFAEASPIPVGDPADPERQYRNAAALLETLHPEPDTLVWCGPRHGGGQYLATVQEWAGRFSRYMPPPFWIPNALDGREYPKVTGGTSSRCDAAVSRPRYALFEIDHSEIPLQVQAAFLRGRIKAGWKVRAVTWSGSKSLHALVDTGCTSSEEWRQQVVEELFPRWTALGADRACRNPSRLSRLPGHWRDGSKEKIQSLIWLR